MEGYEFDVILDVLDIERIFTAKKAGFAKEDLIIRTEDFNIEGIPCLKAVVDSDQYESYLAVVPGRFLSDIYKKYSASLLESNVRSFLKFNGSVNKGIRGTILNEPSKFFVYNNGISTTATDIVVRNLDGKGLYLNGNSRVIMDIKYDTIPSSNGYIFVDDIDVTLGEETVKTGYEYKDEKNILTMIKKY